MSEESDLRQQVNRLEHQVKVLRWVVFFGFWVVGIPVFILLWPLVGGVLLIAAALVFAGLVLYPLVGSLSAGLRGSPAKEDDAQHEG